MGPKLTSPPYAIRDNPVPSLSHLVSMKDQTRLDMKGIEDGREGETDVNMLLRDNINLSLPGSTDPRASYCPDVSLDMSGELISRSDDLVRKLRLLLELRKDELRGIDSSLFSGLLYRSCLIADQFKPQHGPGSHRCRSGSDSSGSSSNGGDSSCSRSSSSGSSRRSSGDSSDGNRNDDRKSEFVKGVTGREVDVKGMSSKRAAAPDSSAKQNLTKKLFNKRDGLFFLATKRKGRSDPVTANKSNLLEIC